MGKNSIIKPTRIVIGVLLFLLMFSFAIISTGCGGVEEFENWLDSDQGSDETETETSEIETEGEVIYEGDKTINSFILEFNKANPDNMITKEMAQAYEHHGSVHENQVKFETDNWEVVLSSHLLGLFDVYIGNVPGSQKTNDEFKTMFKQYAKGFDASLSDDVLENYWQQLLEDSTNHVDFEVFECDLTMYDDRIEYFTMNGNID